MPAILRYFYRDFLFYHAWSVCTGWLLLNLVFYLQEMLEQLFVHRLEWSFVLKLFFYIQPSFLILAFPIGFLSALLLTLGRMSADGELTALRAGGISLKILSFSIWAGAVVYSFFLVAFMDWTLPWGNTAYLRLQHRIMEKKVSFFIREKVFLYDFPEFILYVEKKDEKNDRLEKVWVYLLDEKGELQNQIWAEKGKIEKKQKTFEIQLQLEEGRFQRKKDDQLNDIFFKKGIWVLKHREAPLGPISFRSYRNMKLSELKREIQKFHNERKKVPEAEVEYFKKFSLPFSLLAFAIIGVPLGIRSRGGVLGASFYALLLVVFYWLVLLYAETATLKGLWPAFWAMHAPNALLVFLGLILAGRGVLKRKGTLFFCFLSFVSQAFAQDWTLQQPIRLKADELEYQRESGLLRAVGRVHVEQDGAHLFADEILYDLNERRLSATGIVEWREGEQTLRAEELTYDTLNRSGSAKQVESWSPPWFARSDSVEFQRDKIILKQARFTTCDYPLDEEHYHLRASRLTIRPNRFLTARNVRFYIGKVPVFYFPYFYRNLRDVRVPFSFDTGQTDFLGQFGLLTTHYFLSPVQFGALYMDYFEKKGWGVGMRHEAEISDVQTFSFYGYRIQEKTNRDVRWEGRVRSLMAFSHSLQGRLEVQWPGDAFFSRDYSAARRDPFLVSTQRQWDTSWTWNGSFGTAGFLWRRQEQSDPLQANAFRRTLQIAPRLDATFFPLGLPGFSNMRWDGRANVERVWTERNGFYLYRGNVENGLQQNLKLSNAQNVFARVGHRLEFQDRDDRFQSNKGAVHRLTEQSTWTGRFGGLWETRLTHRFEKKLNRWTVQEAEKKGATVNALDGSLELRPSAAFRWRASTQYDFLVSASNTAKRFSLLRQEIFAAPTAFFDLFWSSQYSFQAKEIREWSMVANARDSRDLWRFRSSLNAVRPEVASSGVQIAAGSRLLDWTIDFSFVLFTNYRLSLLEAYDLERGRFRNRSIQIYRNLHDWEAELVYVQTQGQEKKISFRLNLKAFPGRPLTISEDQFRRITELRRQSTGELVDSAANEFQ